ncbi:uncharacterized protein LOC120350203 [Nilaparvata lugens]|uniref:uncharacterized protein LOC120350203 n=1 Tax=Nilaparvata lugens TaxID=108931 RepID=UPI00193E83A0|nr:uncharacterized protein LOC120350203 [Nilaparvata lugens]
MRQQIKSRYLRKLPWSLLNCKSNSKPDFDSIKLVETIPKPAVTANELPINNFVKPQLQIPTFSGEPHEWNVFKNVFDAAVHTSKDYSSEAKYHLLTSYLSGDALTLVQNYTNTAECYKAAYDSLHK